MTSEVKTRKCLKCKVEKPLDCFQTTPSNFFPGKRSYFCTQCLETMIKQNDLGDVDRLMRWLDLPFDLNKWTQMYEIYGDKTLSAYFSTLIDAPYAGLTWQEENAKWEAAKQEQTIDDEIKAIHDARIKRLKKEWSPAYKEEELEFLEDYYNRIAATQNVSTPILQERARDLCELTLRVKKGMREGIDVKKDMDAIAAIIKDCNFTANNAKSAADFESVGELMVYYGKKGWHPNWHTEPQDSIDFMMENIQNYLRRLVTNEGNFAEQVEDRRARYNMTERLEEIENEKVEFDETADIDYEGEDELVGDLNE